MKKFALVMGAFVAVVLLGAGCSRPVVQIAPPQKNNAVSALSENEILTATYSIGANSSGQIPAAKVVFPPFKSGETRTPALTVAAFVYSDGTVSADLTSGKDYEYFWISKYQLNADHSVATVDITGNFVGEGNDNRTFSVSKVDGKIIAKEENKDQSATPPSIGESAALAIAEKTCVKTGEKVVSPGSYNENSKTWWFDAKLKATPSGCNPACVVSADTKKAAINWRCTGAMIQPNANVNSK